MTAERTAKVKYGVWGLIGGAVITMILGFMWGGWTTASTAQAMTDKALVTSQAAICVAQFVKQPNYDKKLKEFEDTASWTRGEYIGKGGWDVMPGQQKAAPDTARACADGIELLVKK